MRGLVGLIGFALRPPAELCRLYMKNLEKARNYQKYKTLNEMLDKNIFCDYNTVCIV